MRSARTITIFSEEPLGVQGPSSFAISLIVHAAVVGLLPFWIMHSPHIREQILGERYIVRHLEMNTKAPPQKASGSKVAYPGAPQPDAQSPPKTGPAAKPPTMARQMAHLPVGPQTLVQPDIPSKVKLEEEIPVPTVVLWEPGPSPAKTIVASQPHEATAADVPPAPVAPNEEMNLADVGVTAAEIEPKLPVLAPSTTSPVVAPDPELTQKAPDTPTESANKPTPSAVASLSDLQMTQGTVLLPPVDQTVSASAPGISPPGQSKPSASTEGIKPAGSGSGGAQDPGKEPVKTFPTASQAAQNSPEAAPSQESKAASAPAGAAPSTTIRLPKDGHFGVVVVGSSLEETYPQTVGFWSGRLAYTVYLHVGSAKSWILQYSLPRDADAASSGSSIRPDAPWPYTIVRPDLAPGDIDADTLMVRGVVNKFGQLEALSVVFPPHFTKEGAVLAAFRKWEFRPAKQNGQVIAVEVLLIAPEEPE